MPVSPLYKIKLGEQSELSHLCYSLDFVGINYNLPATAFKKYIQNQHYDLDEFKDLVTPTLESLLEGNKDRAAESIYYFCFDIKPGDRVIAQYTFDGDSDYYIYGKVKDESLRYDSQSPLPIQRPVEWVGMPQDEAILPKYIQHSLNSPRVVHYISEQL